MSRPTPYVIRLERPESVIVRGQVPVKVQRCVASRGQIDAGRYPSPVKGRW